MEKIKREANRKVKKLNFFFLFFVSPFLIPALLFSQVDTAWVRRYNGPISNDDEAHAIAIDNNGNVYVTGYSVGRFRDYATIKYVQTPGIREDKTTKIEKLVTPKIEKIYNITGKLVNKKRLKKGIYFKKAEKGIKKILILR
ncbi:MAG: SBBP repeat-containing protein [candidate division WOR-3 bacterium]